MTKDSTPQRVTHPQPDPDGEVQLRAGSRYGKSLPQPDPERVGSVAMGARREFTAKVRDLVEADRAFVMEKLGGDEAAGEFVAAVRWGVNQRPPDRTCLNIRKEIMRSVEEDAARVRDVYISIGARSADDAKEKIAMANAVEGAGPHDGAERCVAYLEAYLNVYPEQRGAAVKRLGGYVPVEAG